MPLGVKLHIGRFAFSGNAVEEALRGTDLGSAAVAQVEPLYKEMARGGRKFICFPSSLTTLTGMGPVAAMPTTTAVYYLYNPDSSWYVVDYLNLITTAGTSAQGASIVGIMTKPTATLPTAGSYHTIVPANPATARSSRSIIAEAYTIPAADATGKNSWTAWTFLTSGQLLAGTVGGADASDAFREGRLIIPPGWGLAMAPFSGAGTTPKFGLHAEWSEIQIDQE